MRPITPDTGLNPLTKAIEVEVGLSLSPNRKRWRPLRYAGASHPPAARPPIVTTSDSLFVGHTRTPCATCTATKIESGPSRQYKWPYIYGVVLGAHLEGSVD